MGEEKVADQMTGKRVVVFPDWVAPEGRVLSPLSLGARVRFDHVLEKEQGTVEDDRGRLVPWRGWKRAPGEGTGVVMGIRWLRSGRYTKGYSFAGSYWEPPEYEDGVRESDRVHQVYLVVQDIYRNPVRVLASDARSTFMADLVDEMERFLARGGV